MEKSYDFQVVLDRESTDDKFGMTYKQTNENLVVASVEGVYSRRASRNT